MILPYQYIYPSTSIKEYINLNIITNLHCNYNCSYCYQTHSKNILELPFLNSKLEIIKKLYSKTNFPILLSIMGGEISLLPITYIEKILKIIYNYNIFKEINIFTNFSKPIDWYNNLAKLLKPETILTISFHEEYHNLNDFIDKINNIKIKNININYMIKEYNISKEIEILNYFKSKLILKNINILFNEIDYIQYNKINQKGRYCRGLIYEINPKEFKNICFSKIMDISIKKCDRTHCPCVPYDSQTFKKENNEN